MLTTEDFKQYKNQSFILQLKKIAHSTEVNPFNYRYLFFGGTGAVGGQVVIELLESYVFMQNISSQNISDKPQFFITGIDHFQIEQFCQKLYAIFGESNFKKVEATDESLEIHFKDFIELHFYVLMAQPKFEIDLDKEIVNYSSDEDKIQFLMSEASKITAPFKDFVLKLQKITKNSEPFRAVVSGIPIPSVATYHFESIDLLLAKHNLVNDEEDKTLERKIKSEILKGLAKDFGLIKERLSEEVLIAHTTSVGGMYQYIDDLAVIKTGYAHSSLGKLLREKQFYAFMLTNYYSEFNLKSLITSAAIGIDYIYKTSTLPLSSGISRLYRVANQNATIPFDLKALKDQHSQKLVNAIFKPKSINTSNLTSEDGNFEIGRQMIVNYALRSGENGIFSLDNAYALYLNMKIASQEELAHVLTYNALFGDDEQKPWFDQHGICYYTQTDNSSLIFSFLNNRSEFRNYQTGTFTVKAFQELGSSKHQSELHTWGLFILLHRISQLKNVINDDDLPTGLEGIKSFIDKKTSKLTLQNVVRFENNYNNLANQFYQLLTVKTVEDMAAFAKIDDSLNQNQKNFLNGVLTLVQETTHSITSLGTPILIADANGNEEILAGPYFAPLDLLLIKSNSLSDRIQQLSTQSGNSQKDLFNWIICNNGVVDLRPLAVFNRAADYNGSLKNDIKIIDNFNTFRAECNALKKENGNNLKEHIPFTSSGLIAYIGRIIGLLEMLEEYDLSLGTYNGWKTLFSENDEGEFILVPGIVEAMRHYTEGLGKITGTEFLYPRYGYFKK
jgi:hypothetical protein